MMIGNLGINSDSIDFDVALGLLGDKRQPLMNAIYEERQKSAPSETRIREYEQLLKAISELQDSLRPNDKTTIEKILAHDPSFNFQPAP